MNAATVSAPSAPTVAENPRPAPERLASLDALRGFDMLWIIGGSGVVHALGKISDNAFTRFLSQQFTHVEWEGLRFYDLIYPLFLFLVGISMVISLDRMLAREGRKAAVLRVLRRTFILYALNLIYNGGFSTRWPDIRVVSGVLAMIAMSYLLAGLIYIFFGRSLKRMAAITAALLLGNWAILGLIPFPDFTLNKATVEALAAQAGSDDPAAVSAMVTARVHGTYEAGHNLSNYLDYRFMPGKKAARYYENQGLLSPMTSVTLCLAGIFAGRLLLNPGLPSRRKVGWLVAGGLAALALGWLWSLQLPVVKRLWTSSYCLMTAGYSALLMALFYQAVDGWKLQRWFVPLMWIGVNPITLYMLYELVDFPDVAARLAGGDVQAGLDRLLMGSGSLMVAFVALGLVLLLARFLHQRRIFLRI